MKKVVLLSLIFLVSIVSAASNFNPDDLRVNHIRIGDYGLVYPWEDDMIVRVSLSNVGQDDLESLVVKVFIDELDVYERSNSFDLDDKDNKNNRKSAWVIVPLENVRPGDYLVRIVVENDKVSKVRHRYVKVLG